MELILRIRQMEHDGTKKRVQIQSSSMVLCIGRMHKEMIAHTTHSPIKQDDVDTNDGIAIHSPVVEMNRIVDRPECSTDLSISFVVAVDDNKYIQKLSEIYCGEECKTK